MPSHKIVAVTQATAPVSSAPQTFHLGTPRDVLDMLEWQIKELEANTGVEGAAAAYRLIAAANTAWALCDWTYWFIVGKKVSGFEQYSKERQFRDFIKDQSHNLAMCRLMADAFKHSHIRDRPEPAFETLKLDWVDLDGGGLAFWAINDQKMKLHNPVDVLHGAHDFWLDFLVNRIGAHERSLLNRSLIKKTGIAQTIEAAMAAADRSDAEKE